MADTSRHSAGLYMTIAFLCVAIGSLKGIKDPVTWILLALAFGWFSRSLTALVTDWRRSFGRE
jgi:hypothetical protein